MKYLLKDSDNSVKEELYSNDKTPVVWSDVNTISVILRGNYSKENVVTTTDTDGEFTYYVPSTFASLNTRASVYIELSFDNSNFPDNEENVKQKIYDVVFKE